MSGLSRMSTATYSTKRNPIDATGGGASATYLENVAMKPIEPLVNTSASSNDLPRFSSAALSATTKRIWTTAAGKQSHTKSSVTVDEVPDIKRGDTVVVGGDDYIVNDAEGWAATTILEAFVYLKLEESE